MMQNERDKMLAGGVVTDEPIYVDGDGNRVSETSPNVRQQLYGAGAILSKEDAKKYGVVAKKKEETPAAPVAPTVEEGNQMLARISELTDNLGEANEENERLRAEVEALRAAQPKQPEGGMDQKEDQAAKQGAPENKSGVPVTTDTKKPSEANGSTPAAQSVTKQPAKA